MLFQNKVDVLKALWPKEGKGLEIGVGTGRFAKALGVEEGIEPSDNMARIAEKRGLKVYRGIGEELLFQDASYDKLLFVTTICFLNDPHLALKEARRVLKADGILLIGLLDRNSPFGKKLHEKKDSSPYYKEASFHSTEDVIEILNKAGFEDFEFRQTLFDPQREGSEKPEKGYGKGAFVAIRARKA